MCQSSGSLIQVNTWKKRIWLKMGWSVMRLAWSQWAACLWRTSCPYLSLRPVPCPGLPHVIFPGFLWLIFCPFAERNLGHPEIAIATAVRVWHAPIKVKRVTNHFSVGHIGNGFLWRSKIPPSWSLVSGRVRYWPRTSGVLLFIYYLYFFGVIFPNPKFLRCTKAAVYSLGSLQMYLLLHRRVGSTKD